MLHIAKIQKVLFPKWLDSFHAISMDIEQQNDLSVIHNGLSLIVATVDVICHLPSATTTTATATTSTDCNCIQIEHICHCVTSISFEQHTFWIVRLPYQVYKFCQRYYTLYRICTRIYCSIFMLFYTLYSQWMWQQVQNECAHVFPPVVTSLCCLRARAIIIYMITVWRSATLDVLCEISVTSTLFNNTRWQLI